MSVWLGDYSFLLFHHNFYLFQIIGLLLCRLTHPPLSLHVSSGGPGGVVVVVSEP